MPRITLGQIEAAINAWRNRKPTHDDANGACELCREARVLADAYGNMIYHRQDEIDAAQLTAEQTAALRAALTEA